MTTEACIADDKYLLPNSKFDIRNPNESGNALYEAYFFDKDYNKQVARNKVPRWMAVLR